MPERQKLLIFSHYLPQKAHLLEQDLFRYFYMILENDLARQSCALLITLSIILRKLSIYLRKIFRGIFYIIVEAWTLYVVIFKFSIIYPSFWPLHLGYNLVL